MPRLVEYIYHVDNKVDINLYQSCFKLYLEVDAPKKGYLVNQTYFSFLDLYKAAAYYMANYATKEERQLFRDQNRKLFSVTKNSSIIVGKSAFKRHLSSDFSNDYCLRTINYARDFMTKDEYNEYVVFMKINYQPLFDIYIANGGTHSLIAQSISKSNQYSNMNISCFIALVRAYVENVLGKSWKDFRSHLFEEVSNTDNIYEIMSKLEIATTDDEVCQLLNGISTRYIKIIKDQVENYIEYIKLERKISDADEVKIKENIYLKISEYLKSQMKSNNGINTQSNHRPAFNEAITRTSTIDFVIDFLQTTGITFRDYCKTKGRKEAVILKIIGSIPQLYEKLCERIAYEKKQFDDYIIRVSKVMVNAIKNGIVNSDGTIREFTILDYYLLVKMDINIFLKWIPSLLDTKDLEIIRVFIFKKNNERLLFPQYIHAEVNKINYGGTIHTITSEQKQVVIDYLMEHNIPLNVGTYGATLRIYLMNQLPTLSINQEYVLKINNYQ